MMVAWEITDYLRDILDAAAKARQFVAEMDFAAFQRDDKTVFAVVRALEIIGEGTKNVPESLRVRYPEVPWREAAGVRDKLSHAYFGVDLHVVWRTVQEILPHFESQVANILEALERGS